MIALVLGLLLGFVPADTPEDVSRCDSLMQVADRRFDDWQNLQERWFTRSEAETKRMRATVDLYRRARQCYGPRKPDAVWETYFDESFLHAVLRDFPASFDVFDAFFDRFQRADRLSPSAFPPDLAASAGRMFQARAFLHYQLGNLGDALGDYSRAIAVTPDSLPIQRADVTRDLGVMHQQAGDVPVAHSYYDRARRILADSTVPTTDEVQSLRARILTSKADALIEEAENRTFDRGAFREALTILQESAEIAPQQNDRQSVRRLINTAVALAYLDAPDAATDRLAEAARAARRTTDVRLQVLISVIRGYVLMTEKRWADARRELKTALSAVRDLRDIGLERRTLRYLGLIEETQQRWSAAASYYRDGIDLVEKQRASISATQWALAAFGEWQTMHRGLVRVLLAQDRPAEAFRVLEQTRARHLTDLRVKTRLSRELPATQRVRYDSLAQALTAVRSRLATESLSADTKARLQMTVTDLIATRRQLLSLDVRSDQTPSLASIQRALDRQGRTLVSYVLDAPNPYFGREPASTAFVVTPDTLRTVPLPELTRDSVRAINRRVSPLFGTEETGITLNATHFDLEALHALHETVLAPVAPHLSSPHRPLVVVPDGPLFQVPFSMLVTSPPPNRFAYDQATYVVHERPTSVELASSLVADTSDAPANPPETDVEIAAYGVSRFDSLRALPSSLRRLLPESYADSTHIHLPTLPGVKRELNQVGTLYDQSRVALNDQATEASLRASLSETRILHLASHAFAHPSSPLYNAFMLSEDRRDPADDGVLFLHEVRTAAAPVPFVVLSGCSTARGKLWSGEGMQGLQYAFRAMGARSTLSNLWPAADRASLSLSETFYRHLRNGVSKDVALQRAQLGYIDAHPDRRSPFFWASTVLYGSPDPLPLSSTSEPWWLYALAAFVFLVVAAGLYQHRSART